MPNDEQTTDTTTAPAGDTFEPITTQDALDAIVQRRVAREKTKIETLTAEVETLTSRLADADKATSDLSAATSRITDLEQSLAEAQGQSLRQEIATAKGVPVALLVGTDREALEASADAIVAFRDESAAAVPTGTTVPTEGTGTTSSDKADVYTDAARALFGSRSE